MFRICITLFFALLVPSALFAGALREEEHNKRLAPIYYSEYGAVGDGVTDDFQAIIDAHEAANITGAKVIADPGAVYYIGGAVKTVVIKTDTDWSGAQFIIDDSAVERSPNNRNVWLQSWVFHVASALPSMEITSIQSLEKNQRKLDISLPYNSVLVAVNNATKQYIRRGADQNNGSNQTDIFIVDRDGNVDINTPIIWDFNRITSITAYPIDRTRLTIKGGRFTTIANKGTGSESYMNRGILITRSNTLIDGLYHIVTEEGSTGAPYNGFIRFERNTNVTIQNSTLSGRRYTGTGTYDISANLTNNLKVLNCDQTNNINSSYWWGIFASNFSKNIYFDNVKFSRFDAHQGVYNVTILNSELGWQRINIIGSGTLTVENTKVNSGYFIYLREDYGSTWEGDIIIRNCIFSPTTSQLNNAELIYARNDGQWNFGYPCYMPHTITIDGLTVEDANAQSSYQGILLFGNFNSSHTGSEPFPYTTTRDVYITNFISSKDYRITNSYLQRTLQVHNQ